MLCSIRINQGGQNSTVVGKPLPLASPNHRRRSEESYAGEHGCLFQKYLNFKAKLVEPDGSYIDPFKASVHKALCTLEKDLRKPSKIYNAMVLSVCGTSDNEPTRGHLRTSGVLNVIPVHGNDLESAILRYIESHALAITPQILIVNIKGSPVLNYWRFKKDKDTMHSRIFLFECNSKKISSPSATKDLDKIARDWQSKQDAYLLIQDLADSLLKYEKRRRKQVALGKCKH